MVNDIIEKLKEKFASKILEINCDEFYRINVHVGKKDLLEVAEFIHSNLNFNHANFCMGTDLDKNLEVAWYVGNTEYREIIALSVKLIKSDLEVSSLNHLWAGMDWHERETYGMLGVVFKDHGDLRRLVLPDEWEGYPLRNDYVYIRPSYRKPEDELIE